MPRMATDQGFFQNYFTTYRRTTPRRSTPFRLWGRAKSTSKSIISIEESVSTRVSADMEVLTNGAVNGNGNGHDHNLAPTEPTSSSFDPGIFQRYLLSLLPPVIGADVTDLQTLFDDEFDERVARFAADNGAVIYVVQVKEESEGKFFLFRATHSANFDTQMIQTQRLPTTLPHTSRIILHT